MNIIGLDEVVFGVEDVPGCARYLEDYGLLPIDVSAKGGRFEALDGTAVTIARADDPALPAALGTGCMLRKTILGVADAATLEKIAQELAKDREVRRLADGSLESVDDMGFVLGFRVTVRRAHGKGPETVNAPGAPAQRGPNMLGVDLQAPRIIARTLSHIVYFVPDCPKATAFYTERLGFRVTDAFEGMGPFIQPAGTQDHHTHFLIQAPAHMQGVEHFTFHFGGPTEVIQNGSRFIEKGYQAFWGPGRHVLGSNWFWYFNSPLACHLEMDADMDLHDESWLPRQWPISADNSQAFLLGYRNKWMPGPDCPPNGDYQ